MPSLSSREGSRSGHCAHVDLRLKHVLDAEWWMLHPNSITRWQRETAYIGMRGVVLEVQLSMGPPTRTWLYPS